MHGVSPRPPWHKERLRSSNRPHRCMESPMTTEISLRTTRVPTHMSRQELGGSAAYMRMHKGAVCGFLIFIRFVTEIRCADPRPQSLLQPRERVTHVGRRKFEGYPPLVVCPRELHEIIRTEPAGTPIRLRDQTVKWSRSLRS